MRYAHSLLYYKWCLPLRHHYPHRPLHSFPTRRSSDLIAGTGTIATDGTVGPIGGIRQKMVGAAESDAEFFLAPSQNRSEEHTSELQSRGHLVCRLLLVKKNTNVI